MKKILILLATLSACVGPHDAERHLGTEAVCTGTGHGAWMCTANGKNYVCLAHDEGCANDVACVETVGGLK